MRRMSVIMIVISCLGVFGVSLFAAKARLKEVAIRKVLGASTLQITTAKIFALNPHNSPPLSFGKLELIFFRASFVRKVWPDGRQTIEQRLQAYISKVDETGNDVKIDFDKIHVIIVANDELDTFPYSVEQLLRGDHLHRLSVGFFLQLWPP
jgi:hypothetical protein